MEIFKMTSRLGIKPKDVIGMGGDIVKMGKSLFNTKVNPKLLEYVNKRGEIPGKILEDIKIHMRSMKNASDNQIELFRLNLKDIFNAKFPPPVTSVKQPATSVKDAAEAFKGWTPRVIKGGKDPEFSDGGIAKLNAQLNQLPEYYLPLANGGLPKGPAGITSLNGWGSKDESQNKAGADISASMDKNPNDPGWGGGDGSKGPPTVINPPKGPTKEEIEAAKRKALIEQQQRQAEQYSDFYKKFKGDTKKKTDYLSRLLKNDPLYQTYVDKGLLDWSNIKGFDLDKRKTAEEIEKAKQSAWGYTRPWDEKDDSLYIRDLEKFDPTWTPGWTGDSKQERLNKRIANTIGHEARHQVLGEGEGAPWGWQGQTMWTGDPYSQKVEIDLTTDENSPYSKFIKEGGLGYEGYTPEITSHELLTRMGDFQSYNNPRVYEDIYENVHGGMPRHLTSDVANKFYDASEQFVKDASARNVGSKYENIDPVIIEGYVDELMREYPEDTEGMIRPEVVRMLKQEADQLGTKNVMDVLKDDYEDKYDYDKEYAKGGIANHFRSK